MEQTIIPVERKLYGDKKFRTFFMRKATAKVMENLGAYEQDAMVEIALCPQFVDSPKLKTQSFGDVGGMSAEELSNWKIDVLKRYADWRGFLYVNSPVALSICERVCQQEDSIDQIRQDERIGYETAIKLLKFGLNEYSVISGWVKNSV